MRVAACRPKFRVSFVEVFRRRASVPGGFSFQAGAIGSEATISHLTNELEH